MVKQRMGKALVLFFIMTTALFASAPSISDIEKQIHFPKEVQQNSTTYDIPSLPIESIKEQMVEDDTKEIHVKGFKFSGNVYISSDVLLSSIGSYADQTHRFSELLKIASIITKVYREEGYFVARAYLPKQRMTDGILEIAIIEGYYGSFQLKNNSSVSDTVLQPILDSIKDEKIISVQALERVMLLIHDTPGSQVTKAEVKPGQIVGTSDFEIQAESNNAYNGYIISDNYGSRYTGKYRLNIGLNANSPFGFGDKIGFTGLLSNSTDLKNGKLYYNFPLTGDGLRGEISVSKTTYLLGEDYSYLDALGHATTLEASLSYPLIRTRTDILKLNVGYSNKHMRDEINNEDTIILKNTQLLTTSLGYENIGTFLGISSALTTSLSLTHGNLDIKDTITRATDATGAKTEGDYTKLTASLEHTLRFNDDYSFTSSARFQKALGNKNLDGSEDFSVGGAYGVRAFPDGELSAENGYIVGFEVFRNLPNFEGINSKVSLFIDHGYAKMENVIDNSKPRYLNDIGIGYHVNYKNMFAKTQLAHIYGGSEVTSEPNHQNKLLLQIGYIY